MSHLRYCPRSSGVGDVLRQCRAQTAEVYGADEKKTMKEKAALAFFPSSHLDLHPSLPGGLVLSNQPLIYDNIWRLAEVGHFSMQISLLGLVQCAPLPTGEKKSTTCALM